MDVDTVTQFLQVDSAVHCVKEERAPASEADQALVELAHVLRSKEYRFTTVTPATHDRVNARAASILARDVAGVFGWNRRFDPSLLPAPAFNLMTTAGIALPDGEYFRSALRLSSLDNNLFFHSAYPTDEHDSVFFGPDTYRFIAAIKKHIASRSRPVRRAVDIGCGAGPGAIHLARACPDAHVLAVDINDRALHLARINARIAGVESIRFHNGNLLDDAEGVFDLIVANPPYLIDAEERAYRHGGSMGWDLSLCIIKAALERLAPGGALVLYTGVAIVDGKDQFLDSVQSLLAGRGAVWTYEEVDPDIFGEELLQEAYRDTDRIAAVVLTVTQQD